MQAVSSPVPSIVAKVQVLELSTATTCASSVHPQHLFLQRCRTGLLSSGCSRWNTPAATQQKYCLGCKCSVSWVVNRLIQKVSA